MRGRAGRRGYDRLGSTVFFSFSRQRAAELIISPMLPLIALPALDIDSILRMLILYHQVSDTQLVSRYPLTHLPSCLLTVFCRAVDRWLYTHSYLAVSSPKVFLFSMDLLFRLHLINQQVHNILCDNQVNFSAGQTNWA